MTDLMAAAVLLLVVCAAGWYVYRSKKKGQKCVGCPHAKECAARSQCCGVNKNSPLE